MAARIHETAIVDRHAELDVDVDVGPYAIVEGGARIARGVKLAAHAVVRGPTEIGEACEIHPFAVVGGPPQAKKHEGGPSRTRLGARNVVREHVTIHGGTEGRTTSVGDRNLFMVGSHVAHAVVVGSDCVLANGVQLAGHVAVGDWATFGGLCAVGQFATIGESAFVAGGAMCERDVPPFVIVQGDRARVRALNVVGLRRRGVPEASVRALKLAFRALFASGQLRADALTALDASDPFVARLVDALRPA
jgi:UDP-N-acetylglucosamine acyltransferase